MTSADASGCFSNTPRFEMIRGTNPRSPDRYREPTTVVPGIVSFERGPFV